MIDLTCPHCGRAFSVADTDAGSVGCCVCGGSYTVPDAPSPLAFEDDDEPTPRRRRPRQRVNSTTALLVLLCVLICVVYSGAHIMRQREYRAMEFSAMQVGMEEPIVRKRDQEARTFPLYLILIVLVFSGLVWVSRRE